MAKSLKNIFIIALSAIAFAFAGVFFVGCTPDYSKVKVTSDTSYLEMEVEESKNITFTVEDAPNGFINNLQINTDGNGEITIEKSYNDNKVVVSVTALKGGTVNLRAVTVDGFKSNDVVIKVLQHSTTLNFDGSVLYVSEKTPLILSNNFYSFESNTTDKDMSFFYITEDIDFNEYTLTSVKEDNLIFTSLKGATTATNYVIFDKVEIDKINSCLKFSLNGEIVKATENLTSQFRFISVYDYSVGNYLAPLYDVRTVDVYQDLNVEILGGYGEYDNDKKIYTVEEFAELDSDITIVPNLDRRDVYILKITTSSNSSNLEFGFTSLSDEIDCIAYNYIGAEVANLEDESVYYLKISSAIFGNAETTLNLYVRYNVMASINDSSVNFVKTIPVKINVAPKEILVNGLTSEEFNDNGGLTLYNKYQYPEFGWQDLQISVNSGSTAEPIFSYAYIKYNSDDSDDLIIRHNKADLPSEEHFTNLSLPIQIRGNEKNSGETQGSFTIYLSSDVLDSDLEYTINYVIKKGANPPSKADNVKDIIYIDYQKALKNDVSFDKYVWTDQYFQTITFSLVSGTDVLTFTVNETPCVEGKITENGEEKTVYYLNFSLRAKNAGKGIYRVTLDNGASVELTFSVEYTLDENNIGMTISSFENLGYYEFSKSSEEKLYYDVLNLEILNQTEKVGDRYSVIYGSSSEIQFYGNFSSVFQGVVDTTIINSMPQGGYSYKYITNKNGFVSINYTMKGTSITMDSETLEDNFKLLSTKEVDFTVNITSYSLVDQFYLTNNGGYAVNNVVYFATNQYILEEDTQAQFDVVANSPNSYNFYQYLFNEQSLAEEILNAYLNDIDKMNAEGLYYSSLVKNAYKNDFISYIVEQKNVKGENEILSTTTSASVAIKTQSGKILAYKDFTISFANGLMFYANRFSYDVALTVAREFTAIDGTKISLNAGDELTLDITFSNIFKISIYGEFNLNNLIYTHTYSLQPVNFILHAYLRQRDYSKMQWDAEIEALQYVQATDISLASSVNEIAFKNGYTAENLVAYVTPNNVTNSTLNIEFVPYNQTSNGLVECSWEKQSAGTYLITVSAEKFYLQNKDNIINLDTLGGKVYIWPAEWGNNFTSISDYAPISVEISFRTGAKNNPYILETAEQVMQINADETSLASHYEIRNVIDMSKVAGVSPIGIVNGELIGFSGSIVGTSSQASITGINITTNPAQGIGTVSVGNNGYAGLFAKINSGSTIENVTFAGSINLTGSSGTMYASLVACINEGALINVEAQLSSNSSNISTLSTTTGLVYGLLVGENRGRIEQNFLYYTQGVENLETTIGLYNFNKENNVSVKQVDGKYVGIYSGQAPKKMAYYVSELNIDLQFNGDSFIGGAVGKSSGTVKRCYSSESGLKLYGYSAYSVYAKINITDSYSETTSKSIYGGGAVGYVSSAEEQERELQGLLVGGKVSSNATSYTDSIGGVVGGANADGNGQNVEIYNNISRTFVRSGHYVGGIAGKDFGVQGQAVDFGNTDAKTTNTIEAIDDGRGANDASLIINYGKSYSDTWKDNFASANKQQLDVYYAIGNAIDNNRNYLIDTVTDNGIFATSFKICTYSQRTYLSGAYSSNEMSISTYFGDFLILKQTSTGYSTIYRTQFTKQSINLTLEDNGYKMTAEGGTDNVYFMYYFDAEGFVFDSSSKESAQEIIEGLNVYTPNSSLYPFTIGNADVQIVASSNDIVSVDLNGDITTRGVGLTSVTLQSLLNVQNEITIYLYIVNYFDKDTDQSLFYASNSIDGLNVVNNSNIYVYGTSQTTIYVVPTYQYNGDFTISKDGILRKDNVSISLKDNTQLTTQIPGNVGNVKKGEFTVAQINGQTVVFYRDETNKVNLGEDNYELSSLLKVKVNGKDYYKYIGCENIDVNVIYRETATAISTQSNYISMQTNETFNDTVSVTSENDELIYYKIRFTDEKGNETIVQQRMTHYDLPTDSTSDEYTAELANWKDDISTISENDLFSIQIEKNGNNFAFSVSVNKNSTAFKNRLTQNIYGIYTITFYANEMENGVSCNLAINLTKAELNNIDVDNYSNINDISVSDNIIVPSQIGVLEVILDPIEAEFETFEIKNAAINSAEGAGRVGFTFVYQVKTEEGVNFVADSSFGTTATESLTFSYAKLMQLIENNKLSYNGKIYIQYILESKGVDEGANIGFDITVTYNDGIKFEVPTVLTAKLDNYVYLTFNSKEESDEYYVARGLSYDMTLSYYGFEHDQIQITTSDPKVASLSGEGRNYKLNITSTDIPYQGGVGYEVLLFIYASKTVDGRKVEYSDTLTVYVMEYVFNYTARSDTAFDLVKGMNNGVITTAIGNAYALELDIYSYLEYDATNEAVVNSVQSFVDSLTSSVTFTVYDNSLVGGKSVLSNNKQIKSDYYLIKGNIFTPIRLYEPNLDIYYFELSGKFGMLNGLYTTTESASVEMQPLFTRFDFSIHQQSADESPIPVENYEDLLEMEDGQWYILLNNIDLPNEDNLYYDQFQPLTQKVAGFDGNGYSIRIQGDYRFDAANIGLFEQIGEGAIIKNVNIEVVGNSTFYMSYQDFNVGLLSATNNGIITNCQVSSENASVLSVEYTTSSTASSVAGLVVTNTGKITNSRSSLNLYTKVNLSGFVATNSGVISSSYFLNGSLKNETNTSTQYTAGFVLNNSGEIYTSYVSGKADSNDMYYKGADNYIKSDNTMSGFVYTNSGSIQDCYSNINLQGGGSLTSGFVFENTGDVSKSFSTSVLTSYNTQSYGFARINSGTISEAYWLSEAPTGTFEGVNYSVSTIDNNDNTSIFDLKRDDFNLNSENFAKYFGNFVYTSTRNYNSVWFYSSNSGANFNKSTFNTNRLELVAPNIIATSQRYLFLAEEVVDEVTGITTVEYHYNYTDNSGELGSAYNPILLYNAQTFEEYILNENDSNNYNYSYYRLIDDINYSEYAYNSEVYNTKFMGYLEGNFMDITAVHMLSSSVNTYAGLFAEVGSSTRSNAIGTLLNFTYSPEEVVFTNTEVVGAIAGRLDGGVVANVSVLSDESIVVSGMNIVGGVIGMAVGYYRINNVISQVSAKASYKPDVINANTFDQSASTYIKYSFAGSVAGVLSGTGVVKQVEVTSAVSVLADKAGALFGLIDSEAGVDSANITVTDNLLISAYTYGGLLAGEIAGNLLNSSVIGTDYYLSIFQKQPVLPSAVGGVAGLISGGYLKTINMSQSLNLSELTADDGIKTVGGIAGVVTGGVEFEDVHVNASLIGYETVGGFIGRINASDADSVSLKDISLAGALEIKASQTATANLGGVIGLVERCAEVKIDNSTDGMQLHQVKDREDALVETNGSTGEDTYEAEVSALKFDDDNKEILPHSATAYSEDLNIIAGFNTIEFTAKITCNVYSAGFVTYLGNFVGRLSVGLFTANKTISKMDANVDISDLGITSGEKLTGSVSVAKETLPYYYREKTDLDWSSWQKLTSNGTDDILTDLFSIAVDKALDSNGFNQLDIVDANKLNGYTQKNATTCVFYQNISYSCNAPTDLLSYSLNIFNYGACATEEFIDNALV